MKKLESQPSVKQELRRLVVEDKLPHAILLHGPRSNGKLELALWLSSYLMCNRRGDNPCGQCPDCKKTEKLIHPDVHFSFPIYPKNKEKTSVHHFMADWRKTVKESLFFDIDDWMTQIGGQTRNPNISAYNCNEIIHAMGLKSYQGKSKIMMVWMAQYLDRDANRLLKLIEEPPKDTFILLISEQVDRILSTIRSRCLELFVPPLKPQYIQSYLIQSGLASDKKARWIADLSQGNLREAVRLSGDSQVDVQTLWIDWLRFGLNWSNHTYVQWVKDFSRTPKQSQRMFFQHGFYFLQRLLHHKVSRNSADYDDDRVLVVMADKLDFEQIYSTIALCEQGLYNLQRNGNAGIIMMDTGIKFRDIIKKSKIVHYGM